VIPQGFALLVLVVVLVIFLPIGFVRRKRKMRPGHFAVVVAAAVEAGAVGAILSNGVFPADKPRM